MTLRTIIPFPPFSVKGSGTRLLGSGATGSGLPAPTELQSRLPGGAAVREILRPTVLGAPGSQPRLAHQLLDRKCQQHASHRIQSSPTRKMLQVYAKGKRKSEGGFHPPDIQAAGNDPSSAGGNRLASTEWRAGLCCSASLVQSSPPSDLHLYRSLKSSIQNRTSFTGKDPGLPQPRTATPNGQSPSHLTSL